ncbi:hypothetical protein ASD48_04120 [Streptomyces sp. Root1310]|nr:hypothetical protein ASD48_04120 [Streptomyces sp. Root1310]
MPMVLPLRVAQAYGAPACAWAPVAARFPDADADAEADADADADADAEADADADVTVSVAIVAVANTAAVTPSVVARPGVVREVRERFMVVPRSPSAASARRPMP